MHADNSIVSVSAKTIKEIETKLNTSGRQIATWCCDNKMAFDIRNKANIGLAHNIR